MNNKKTVREKMEEIWGKEPCHCPLMSKFESHREDTDKDKRFCEKHNDYSSFIDVIECNECNFLIK